MVILSQAYVKNSVHRGGGDVCLSAYWDTPPSCAEPPLADIPPGRHHLPLVDTPWQTPPRQTPPGQTPPWADTNRQTPQWADIPLSRYPPPRVDTPWADTPSPAADGYCCGRYASYWNAFSFVVFFCSNNILKDLT